MGVEPSPDLWPARSAVGEHGVEVVDLIGQHDEQRIRVGVVLQVPQVPAWCELSGASNRIRH